MLRIVCYTFLLVVVFGFERVSLSSLRKRSAEGESVFPAKEFNHSGVNVPAFVMGLYRNPQRISVTVHSIVGQATPGRNGISFKLNGLHSIRTDETIMSAKIRIMVKTIGPQPPFAPSNGYLVLYDQFNHKPLQSVAIQGGEARLVVLPLLSLVKRWLLFPRANHGVFIRMHSNHQEDKKSLRVTLDCAEEAKDNRPMLIVKTLSKPQKIYAGSFRTSNKKMVGQKPKSRSSRAIHDQGPCSRRPMRVEISKNIRWPSVIFPKFFDAYRCGGDCKFPLDKKVDPTTYAIMQARLHFLRPDLGTSEPCCVPINLTGIKTIQYNGDNVYSVRFYEEMVVEECGCR